MMQHKGYPLRPATATRGEGVQRVNEGYLARWRFVRLEEPAN